MSPEPLNNPPERERPREATLSHVQEFINKQTSGNTREGMWEPKFYQRLEEYAEGYDLYEQEALWVAINETVNTHNLRTPERQLTTLQVYTWILGDARRAAEAIRSAEGRIKLQAAAQNAPQEKFKYMEEQSKKAAEDPARELSLEHLAPAFINELRTRNVQGIRFDALDRFLGRISMDTIAARVDHTICQILRQRIREVERFPSRATTIVRVLISSIKSVFNRTYGLRRFQFDERAEKAAILTEQRENAPGDEEIMSNIDGRITGVTFALEMRMGAADHYHIIAQLMQTKRDEPQFVVTCLYAAIQDSENFRRFLRETGVRFPPPRVDFVDATQVIMGRQSVWVRDGAVRRNNGTILEPAVFRQNPDAAYGSLVPVQGTDIQQSDLAFEGGNIRSTATHVFIGFDCIERTVRRQYRNENWQLPSMHTIQDKQIQETIERFRREFGKEVVVIGSREHPQPVFHIDMFLTPLNERTILVGRPILGPDTMQPVCDQLRGGGFTVIRIPYGEDHHLTYNNALIEQYRAPNGTQVRRVYLPQYYLGTREQPIYSTRSGSIDLARLNREAIAIYRGQGFEVVPIQVSMNIIGRDGSLNCLTFEDRQRP